MESGNSTLVKILRDRETARNTISRRVQRSLMHISSVCEYVAAKPGLSVEELNALGREGWIFCRDTGTETTLGRIVNTTQVCETEDFQ